MNIILIKKALRSIWRNKTSYASCIVLIAIGVFSYVALYAASQALDTGSKIYYKQNRMADAFSTVKAIPAAQATSLQQIDGIDEVQLRLRHDARVPMDSTEKTVYIRFISYDKNYNGVSINQPDYIGLPIVESNDIWVVQSFLDAHKLKIGDKIIAIINNKDVSFHIVGSVNAPDYIYTLRDASNIFPDAEGFGIAYVDQDYLQSLLGTHNTFNEVNFTFVNGYTYDDVKDTLKTELEQYGLESLVPRKDQISYKMLDAEITQDRAMSTSIPVLFSSMAGIVLFLMLKRMIEQERIQIGTMKAFGYSSFVIVIHYVMYGVVTSFVGGLLGLALGILSIKPIVDLYTQYFVLPYIPTQMPPTLAVTGMSIAVFFGAIGAYLGAHGTLSLHPAEAMRPPSPPPIKGDIIKTFPMLKKILSSRGNMGLRNILRSKVRSGFIVLGVMFSFGIIAMMGPLMSMMTDMMVVKYVKIEAYDAKLSLAMPQKASVAVQDAFKIDGVTMAEPIREIPAEVWLSNRKKNYMIIGIRDNTTLYRLYDDLTGELQSLPKSGFLITKFVADDLGAKIGDELIIKTIYNNGKDEEISVRVSGIINQNMTSVCYIQSDILNEMLNIPDQADSIIIRTDNMSELRKQMDNMKNVVGLEDTKSTVTSFLTLMGSYQSMMWVFSLIGVVIAFAIIYNSSNISMSEKKREYATLRVLGLSVREISEIHSFEYWTLAIIGCLLGIPFTSLLLNSVNEMVKTVIDAFAMPTQISFSGIVAGFVGCFLAVAFSNLSAKIMISKLDMVDVLKERE